MWNESLVDAKGNKNKGLPYSANRKNYHKLKITVSYNLPEKTEFLMKWEWRTTKILE